MTHKPALSPFVAFLPLVILVAFLSLTIYTFGDGALSGGSQISLLVATAVCIAIGMWAYKVPWTDFEKAIEGNVKRVTTALLILLAIGALSGSWMVSGIVPTMIYYGMEMIHPDFFLFTSCLICALVSVMTGSSWTTIATIGIALMGIGQAQGFSEGWIAGAIVSGAYFGDKMSPLSDTTVLASSTVGVRLFTHIRYMFFTTVPAMAVALLVFLLAGFSGRSGGGEIMHLYSAGLQDKFNLSLFSLLIPVLTGVMIYRRVPSLITLFMATLMASAYALIFQPDLLFEISGLAAGSWESQFRGLMQMLFGATSLDMGHAMLNDLVATGGMSGMMDTIWLILCAMCFGGAMAAGGFLEAITRVFVRAVHHTFGLVASTVGSGIFMNLVTADQYISIILTGNMYREAFHVRGYEARLLSRTVEDAVTVTSPLIPWNTCGMTQATVLGVSTWTYLPYCVFNYLCPLMSMLMALLGYKIFRRKGAPAPDGAADETHAAAAD